MRVGRHRFLLWLRVCALLSLYSVPALHAAILPPIWRWSNPAPHGANIMDIAFNGELYVQVGERGQIFTSTDGQSWLPRASSTSTSLRAVTFFNGRIVITGENGTILIADDPADFYQVGPTTTDWLEGVAASTTIAVAVGDNGSIYTSTNAVNWQRLNVPFTTWLTGVAFGTNTFVAVGEGGFIATSTNGTTWTTRSSGTTVSLVRVGWVGSRFLSVGTGGKVLSSARGDTWQTLSIGATNALYTVAGNTNASIAAGYQELRMLEISGWTNQLASTLQTPAPTWSYYASTRDDLGFLVGGATGLLIQSRTTNGVTSWLTDTNSIRTWLWGVAHLGSNYVAVGDHGSILTSPNGIDWELEFTPAAATNQVLLGVGGTTNLLLAAGTGGTILWATNSYQWNALTSNPTTNDLQGVLFDGEHFFLSGGNGTILTSPSTDGTDWTRHTTPTTNFLMSVARFPGGWVAVGDNGTILTSTNTITWSSQNSGTTNWLSQVRHLNGSLIAVGENGTVLTSTNGTNWSSRTSTTTSWLNAVDYVDRVWLVVGNQGTVLISTDLTNWVSQGTLTKKSLYGLAIHQGQLVTVGSEGVIIRSQLIPATTPVAIQQYSRTSSRNLFLLTGQPGQQFSLDSSEDLPTWITGPLLEFMDGTGTLLYLDDVKTNTPGAEFYRSATLY